MNNPHPKLNAFSACLILLSLFIPATAYTASQIGRVDYKKRAPGTSVVLNAIFQKIPSSGFLPVSVQITNSTNRDREWTISATSNTYNTAFNIDSTFTLPCKATSSITHTILVPLSSSPNLSNRSINFSIHEDSLGREKRNHYADSSYQWPSIGISKSISDEYLTKLVDERQTKHSSSNDFFGHTFAPEDLPADWRAFSGFDALIFSLPEWATLRPGVHQAILAWNRLGGELILYPTDETNSQQPFKFTDDLTIAPNGLAPRSLGSVRLHPNAKLDVKATIKHFKNSRNKTTHFDDDYKNWSLLSDFGSRPFNVWIVLVVLLLFGIVVGPINFWVLAPAGQRHRLFITTPLLSVVTCALLGLTILIGDGIGGDGLRFTVINLEPHASERRAFITQEQISRTGLLVRSGFSLDNPTVINPVTLPPSRWTRPKHSSSNSDRVSIIDKRYTGDWFRSRREAGYHIQSTLPTRARIELVEPSPDDGPPVLFSSLGFTLDHFFYVDTKGKVWQSTAPTSTGQPIPLEPTNYKAMTKWWNKQCKPASKGLTSQLEGLRKHRRNIYIAASSDRNAPTITTGDFIDWKNSRSLVFGTPLTVAQPLTPSPQDGLQ